MTFGSKNVIILSNISHLYISALRGPDRCRVYSKLLLAGVICMRKDTRKTDLIIIVVLVLLIAAGVLYAVLSRKSTQNAPQQETTAKTTSYKDYNGKKIGIVTGTSFEQATFDNFPDSEYLYFNSTSDTAAALSQGKIDGFLGDEPTMRVLCQEQKNLDYFREMLTTDDYAFGFQKNDERADKIRTQFNEMLSDFIKDGTLDAMGDKWFGDDESAKVVDLTGFSGENGKLRVVTTASDMPFSYIKDNENVGLSIELVEKFCRRYGYTPVIDDVDFSARLSGLSSGMYDMCASSLAITEERKESINFSDTFYKGGIVLTVRASDLAGSTPSSGVTKDTPLSYFRDKRIGILTGSAYEPVAEKMFPDAKYFYYDVSADLALATVKGKIDGYLMSSDQANTMIEENPSLFYLNEKAEQTPFAFAFPKTDKGGALRDKVNEFLAKISADGTMDKLLEKWTGGDLEQYVDLTGFTGENGTLNIACDGTTPPWEFTYNGSLTGYEIELVAMFCREYGYTPKFDTMTFSAVIPAIASEKYDMAAANISVTKERAESVYFSDKESGSDVVFVTKGSSVPAADGNVPKYSSAEELNVAGMKIGVETGSSSMFKVEQYLPNAQVVQCTDKFSGFDAVSQGMFDAFVFDRRQMQLAIDNGVQGVTLLDDNLGEDTDIAVGIAKNPSVPDLKNKLNEFIAMINSNGVNEDAFRRWVFDKNYEMPDIPKAENPTFTLKIGTTGIVEPYSFYKDNVICGYDIEMATRFAAWMNAGLEIKIYDYSGIILALQSGDIDCIFANLNNTPERAEVIDFSDPLYVEQAAVMVATVEEETVQETEPGFFESIALSFEKNFIRENRWELILEGIGTTCLITVMSTLFGTILAFAVCMFRRTGSRLAELISNLYVKLLQGTPMVVLLMILYYVILGKSGLSAVWVAIVGFSLNFGAYASEIMRSGIESIDAGQREAALALGYSENQAFFRFIFPQAAVRFLPVYKGEIISLLKGTSIVGYIAIQDLTKMGDIIRSRTYEAFFPLIATAVIYFILAWIISLILKFILKSVSPKKKKGTTK